ncbi:hypothetical protein NWP21_15740 [Anabaenopsis sp. FSS-46]|uniref:hypothetical protein n=1 Tax=Anabaenopsis sp. FSS-46 TaxID=2971766 RepID=UPI0024737971|nr:hypothetical protein [Anabaenopsis sp. FSS-46]MDH6100263.1 hypothetical protein [Anabaenopsis sp. FSS-46]
MQRLRGVYLRNLSLPANKCVAAKTIAEIKVFMLTSSIDSHNYQVDDCERSHNTNG